MNINRKETIIITFHEFFMPWINYVIPWNHWMNQPSSPKSGFGVKLHLTWSHQIIYYNYNIRDHISSLWISRNTIQSILMSWIVNTTSRSFVIDVCILSKPFYRWCSHREYTTRVYEENLHLHLFQLPHCKDF